MLVLAKVSKLLSSRRSRATITLFKEKRTISFLLIPSLIASLSSWLISRESSKLPKIKMLQTYPMMLRDLHSGSLLVWSRRLKIKIKMLLLMNYPVSYPKKNL